MPNFNPQSWLRVLALVLFTLPDCWRFLRQNANALLGPAGFGRWKVGAVKWRVWCFWYCCVSFRLQVHRTTTNVTNVETTKDWARIEVALWSMKTPTTDKCQGNSCLSVYGWIYIDGEGHRAVARSCNFTLPPGIECLHVDNYKFDDNLLMIGDMCPCNGTKCNNVQFPFTAAPTTLSTTIITTTTNQSTTDPDTPVASTNDWSLSVLTLLIVYCTFYVL
ncbi:unnamed protein product [Bursaphelenchus okinawaensis]|uniref:TGF_BETA_2 domain-containing protein n=1 Tax=Bursaphelenchus okinawaensis TaxID=465554 RepID=A0A811KC29_9BILA|nr:unnamed protein product [Bursaphelenchus okinawaensis]CAG9098180.1 unnamed protein product [Bursaphelenchus okinawaensis]